MYTLMKELGTNWVPKIEYAVRAKKKDKEAGENEKAGEDKQTGKEDNDGQNKKDEEKEKWYKFEKVTQRRAVINDSLFLRFMKKRITRTKFDHCHDFIVLKFNYNVKYRVGKNKKPETKTANELRELFYKKGFEFSYDKTNKAGEVVDSTTVRYKMLMRSPGKAKNGECIFIRDSLYDTAIKYLTMGLFKEMQKKAMKNPDAVFNIVGLSAYQTLTTATAYGYIQIPLDNILILKDIEVESEPMAAAIVSAKEKPPEKKDDEETGEQGKGTKNKGTQGQEEKKEEPKKYICSVEHTKARIKNVLWDGMGLIDDAEFPVGMDGFIYCRSHFFKSCLFRGQLQRFFKDYCKEHGLDYSTYAVKVLSGNDADIYNAFKNQYEQNASQLKAYEDQIQSTERIYNLLNSYIEAYKAGTITANEAQTQIQILLNQLNNGLISADANLMNVLQYSKDITGASGSSAEQVLAGIKDDLKTSGQDLLASLRQYEENSKLIGEQTTSWQQLTKDVSEMLSVLKDVKKALKESERDDDEDEDDDSSSKKKHHSKSDGPGKSAWSNKDENNGPGAEINRKKAGIAHSGLEAGVVGQNNEDSEEAWMKSMGLKELDPKEYPYILKAGEQVINEEQRHRLISNVDKGYGQAYTDGLKKGIEAMSKSGTQVNNTSYTVNAPIDKIVLQNVQDPDGFAKALYENLSLTMAQQRSKFKF